MKRFPHGQPPLADVEDLTGRLFVIEGPDAVGRSTQIELLSQWLQREGHDVATAGLSRSRLAGPELQVAKQGNLLRPRTMALFYAADLYDQLERQIIPALRAGSVVLADRYVPSLMARSMVRGLDRAWLEDIYSRAARPDAMLYLKASPKRLVERMLHKYGELDFWEAGMDLGLSTDWHESFVRYQKRVGKALGDLGEAHDIQAIDANRSVATVHKDLRARLRPLL